MAATPQDLGRNTPKNRVVSKMMLDNIVSAIAKDAKGTSCYNAVWERTVYFQNYQGNRVSNIQLKLDTDLILNNVLFKQLFNIISAPISTSSNPFESDQTQYMPQNFQNIIHNIVPGKHYLEYMEYKDKKAKGIHSYHTKYKKFTGIGYFQDPAILSCIRIKIEEIKQKMGIDLEHSIVGINYRAADPNTNEPQHINIEIKFKDRRSGLVIFRTGDKEEEHPKKEIVLNIHLYHEQDVWLFKGNRFYKSNARIIANRQNLSTDIQGRIKDFFSSAITYSQWLSEKKKPMPCKPHETPKDIRNKQLTLLKNRQTPLFYAWPVDPRKKQGYALFPITDLPQSGKPEELKIYIDKIHDYQISIIMLDLNGHKISAVVDTPYTAIPDNLTMEFLRENDRANESSILAAIANARYIGKQISPPKEPVVVTPVIPSDATLEPPAVVEPEIIVSSELGALAIQDEKSSEATSSSEAPLSPHSSHSIANFSPAQLICLQGSPIYSPPPISKPPLEEAAAKANEIKPNGP